MLNFKRNIKTEVLTKTVALLCLAVISTIVYSYISSKSFAVRNASNLVQQLNISSITETTNYLNSSRIMAETSAYLFTAQPQEFSIEQDKDLIKYMLGILGSMSHITSVSMATETGILISVDNIQEQIHRGELGDEVPEHSHYRIHYVNKIPSKPINDWIFCDVDYNIALKKESIVPFPENRSFTWYQRAAESKKSSWTDVHLLYTNNTPGVTSSSPIMDQSGHKVRGVFAVDISLKEISTFLNQMRVSDNTRAFIINTEGKIVGDSDMLETVKVKGENNSLLTIKDLDDKILLKSLEIYKSASKEERDEPFYLNINKKEYLVSFNNFPESLKLPWQVVSITPVSDFSEGIMAIQKNTFFIGLIVLAFSIIFIYFQTQKLSDPIKELAYEANKIKSFDLKDDLFIKSNIKEIEELSASMRDMKVNLGNFSKYIPRGLITKFMESGQEVSLGGDTHNITILFSDVANFTSVSEGLRPSDLMLHLSDYFEELTEILLRNNGTIDKFIGDAIMAFWGAPQPDESQAYNACRAALLCQQKLRIMNKYWQSINKPALVTRMGINSGPAVVGNMGSSERMNYTAIGDSVNLAARLEGTNKMYGTNIIISEKVFKDLPEGFVVRPIDVVAVKGKKQGVKIFELIGLNGDNRITPLPEASQQFYHLFTQAFDLYLSRQWKQARELLTSLQQDNEEKYKVVDSLVPMYLARCDAFIKEPPAPDWDGVVHLKEK